jgi:hypothetical protein
MFEKRVQRRILRAQRDGIIGSWGKLHNEELHNLYSSSNVKNDQVKEDEMGRECSTHGRRGIHAEFLWGSKKERDD